MSHPNQGTAWSAQDGQAEAALDLKEPIAEHDPNVGTRWADPVDDTKPRPRVKRDIDKFIDQPVWKCPDCGFETLTENGKVAHSTVGGDGKTRCQRERSSYKDMKDCSKCKGTGRGVGVCLSCDGSGEGTFEAKCRGCNGKGKLRESDEGGCNICGGSGTRTYCKDCAGSGEVAHCSVCSGSGKVDATASPVVDEDALARKISEPIITTMKEGFEMLAAALSGTLPKPKGRKAKNATSRVVRGTAASGGSKPVPAVEHADPAVDDPSP